MQSAASYRSLIQRLQADASARPRSYRFKLLLLALLGYGVLLFALALALSFSLGVAVLLLLTKSVWAIKLIKFVWIPLLLAWMILRALWVKIQAPEGYRLSPAEAPLLQAEVERLRKAAGAPPLAGIVIDDDLNAAAASVPRLLGLAGSRHYLVLGLPLLQLLDRDQLGAVIAHEFGHFRAGHGRFSGWIYRVRLGWYRLLEALAQQQSMVSGLFVRFFNWYAPYFNAYSFVLARESEFEADAISAQIVGAPAVGEALTRVDLGAQRLQCFWPEVYQLAGVRAQPPERVYQSMALSFAQCNEGDSDALQRALLRQADLDDTHPSLAQRLQALQLPAVVPEPPREPAVALLGELASTLQERFSEQWRAGVAAGWEERHNALKQGRVRLEELLRTEKERLLEPAEHLELGSLLEDLQQDRDPMPCYRSAVDGRPDSALAHFRLGAVLLQRQQAEGIGHIERAMSLDPEAVGEGLECLGSYHHALGDQATLDALGERHAAWQAEQARQQAERFQLGRKDHFTPHTLSEQQLAGLRSLLRQQGRIRRAWLVNKRINDASELPHFVLLLRLRTLVLNPQKLLEQLVDQLDLPGSVLAVAEGGDRKIEKRIRKTAKVPLYKHAWW